MQYRYFVLNWPVDNTTVYMIMCELPHCNEADAMHVHVRVAAERVTLVCYSQPAAASPTPARKARRRTSSRRSNSSRRRRGRRSSSSSTSRRDRAAPSSDHRRDSRCRTSACSRRQRACSRRQTANSRWKRVRRRHTVQRPEKVKAIVNRCKIEFKQSMVVNDCW